MDISKVQEPLRDEPLGAMTDEPLNTSQVQGFIKASGRVRDELLEMKQQRADEVAQVDGDVAAEDSKLLDNGGDGAVATQKPCELPPGTLFAEDFSASC